MGYAQCLKTMHAAGAALNTFTTAKSVINAQAIAQIPGLCPPLQVGDMLEIEANGSISNIITTPGLINFQVKMGPTSNIVAFDTLGIQLNATAHTTLPFWLRIALTLRSEGNGTAAQFMGQSYIHGVMFTKTAGQVDDLQADPVLGAPATAPALGTGFDSTTASFLDLWAGWTISNVGNQIQVQQYRVMLHSERN